MKDNVRILGLSTLLCCANAVWAQQAPPADAPGVVTPGAAAPAVKAPAKATAQSEAGEPRANTSDPRADAAEPAPLAARPASAGKAPVSTVPPKSGGQKSANVADKLQLGTATVTGDREQPKVMYVVPWKRPDIGDAEGKPMNSLVDEILSPVDRDVFRREVRYYQTVKSNADQNGAPPAAEQVEK